MIKTKTLIDLKPSVLGTERIADKKQEPIVAEPNEDDPNEANCSVFTEGVVPLAYIQTILSTRCNKRTAQSNCSSMVDGRLHFSGASEDSQNTLNMKVLLQDYLGDMECSNEAANVSEIKKDGGGTSGLTSTLTKSQSSSSR